MRQAGRPVKTAELSAICMDGSWSYFSAPLSAEPSTFGPFAPFVDLWRSKYAPARLPAWRDFDIMDFKDWWGWVTVIDFLSDDVRDHRYRLWGAGLVEVLGIEMTGHNMAYHWDPADDSVPYSGADVMLLEAVRDGPQLGYAVGPVDVQFPGLWIMNTIRLPLSNGGEKVDGILSAVIVSDPGKTETPSIAGA